MSYEFDFESATKIDVDLAHSGIGSAVAPLAFRDQNGSVRPQGTTFCILNTNFGQAVFATARHNVADLEERTDLEAFILLPEVDDATRLVGQRVNQISIADTHSDVSLAIIDTTESANPIKAPARMSITFSAPIVGQNTMALGYGMRKGHSNAGLVMPMTASRGEVRKIYSQRRDSSLSNFPTFVTDSYYFPGMSGGPILDVNGHVTGIVSHSMIDEDDGFEYGHGACMAALLEHKMDLKLENGNVREFAVPELVASGLLSNMGPAVKFVRDDTGVRIEWESEV